jgi:hypothetical protein
MYPLSDQLNGNHAMCLKHLTPGQLPRGFDLLTLSISISPVVSQTVTVFDNILGNPPAFSQHPSSMA